MKHGKGRRIAPALLGLIVFNMGGDCSLIPQSSPAGSFVFEGLNSAILSVSGTTADDVYAVGADSAQDNLGPYVLHYDGQNWKRLVTGVQGALWWVSVEPIDGAFWMCGENGNILRYDPATNDFDAFTTPGEKTLFGIWGAAGDGIWAVGGDLDAEESGGVILHYDGSDWTPQDLSSLLPDGTPTLFKVWGRSATDVYVVGQLGTILHFDGTHWSTLESGTTRTLFTINGNEDGAVAVGGFGDAVILEEHPEGFDDHSPAGVLQTNGVYVRGDKAVAVGNEVTVVRRNASDEWVAVTTGLDSIRDFHGTWIDPDGGIWAVGGNLGASLNDGIIAYIGSATISSNVEN